MRLEILTKHNPPFEIRLNVVNWLNTNIFKILVDLFLPVSNRWGEKTI